MIEVKAKKPLTLNMALLPFIFLFVILYLGYIQNNLQIEALLLLATAFSSFIAYIHNYTWSDVLNSIVDTLTQYMPAILMLLTIGFLLGAWMVGGTIPMFVYYGLLYLSPNFFYLSSFILCALISTVTGSSWTTASTLGVALMGVALSLNLSLEICAGAIISGSYLGDKLSPLSENSNIAAKALDINLFRHIIYMLYTTFPCIVICILIYIALGSSNVSLSSDTFKRVNDISKSLNTLFTFNIFLLIPCFYLIYASIKGTFLLHALVISSILAIVNAFIFQGFSLSFIFDAVIEGFDLNLCKERELLNQCPSVVNKLVGRGSVLSMLSTLSICLCALAFLGSIKVTKSHEILSSFLLKNIKSAFSLVLATICVTLFLCAVTTNSQLSLVISASLFKDKFNELNLAPENLSRAIEDSSTTIEPLFPWTVASIYMSATLGVSTLDYLPYAFFNYLPLLVTLIFTLYKIKIHYLSK